jgi:hypothetical protein
MYYSILFTGHMIDKAGRALPRFSESKEGLARKKIKEQLSKEKQAVKEKLKGIAGGACGGDILFHELCLELNIASEIFLALPVKDFKKSSVSFAGKGWEDRYEKLIKKLPVHVLPQSNENNTNNVWERANVWMLESALKNGGENMSLIALWDGKPGDSGGGTEHMIKVAKKHGAKTKIIDIKKL